MEDGKGSKTGDPLLNGNWEGTKSCGPETHYGFIEQYTLLGTIDFPAGYIFFVDQIVTKGSWVGVRGNGNFSFASLVKTYATSCHGNAVGFSTPTPVLSAPRLQLTSKKPSGRKYSREWLSGFPGPSD